VTRISNFYKTNAHSSLGERLKHPEMHKCGHMVATEEEETVSRWTTTFKFTNQ